MKLGKRGAGSSAEVKGRVWQAEVTAMAYGHFTQHLNRLKFTSAISQSGKPGFHVRCEYQLCLSSTHQLLSTLSSTGNMAKLLMAAITNQHTTVSSFYYYTSVPPCSYKNPFPSDKEWSTVGCGFQGKHNQLYLQYDNQLRKEVFLFPYFPTLFTAHTSNTGPRLLGYGYFRFVVQRLGILFDTGVETSTVILVVWCGAPY